MSVSVLKTISEMHAGTPADGTFGIMFGVTVGGTIGQAAAEHTGGLSPGLVHIACICPPMHRQKQSAWEAFDETTIAIRMTSRRKFIER